MHMCEWAYERNPKPKTQGQSAKVGKNAIQQNTFPAQNKENIENFIQHFIEVASFSMKKRIQGLTLLQLELHHPIKP